MTGNVILESGLATEPGLTPSAEPPMNFFKTFGVALVLCISLLLSGVACVLIATSMKQQPPIGDADVVVAGVGNSGNSISAGPSPRRLARRAIERDVAPPVDDATLQATVRALIDRAR